MADQLISPKAYTTPGAVPRRLVAGIFLFVSLTAMTVFMLTSHDAPLMTGDQRARAELRKPEAVANQARGTAQWVDEAADRATADSLARTKSAAISAAAASSATAAASGVATPGAGVLPSLSPPPAAGAAPPLPSWDDLPSSVGVARGRSRSKLAGEVDAAAAGEVDIERERTARAAASTVFDEGQPAGALQGMDAVTRGSGPHRGVMAPDLASTVASIEALQALPNPLAPAGAPGLPSTPAAARGASPPQANAPEDSRSEGQRSWARQAAATPDDEPPLTARPPAAPWMLTRGTVIPSVLTRGLHSDLPGVVTARVAMDVYDSRTSRRLLLPKGTLLVGAYNHDVQPGQDRMQFAFDRMELPHGATFRLPGAPASDQGGMAGVEGQVNRHFFRRFGSALLLGVLADRVTRSTALPAAGPYGSGQLSATGQVFVDTARSELERHRTLPPTVTIPAGTRIHVEVAQDMAFDPTTSQVRSW